jgi:DNA-binding Xre family transcriptional regulator
MAISYIKFWKLLLDKKLKKTDLLSLADISTTTLAKLSKDQPVSMEVMDRICSALSCDIGDVMEIVPTTKRTCRYGAQRNSGQVERLFSETFHIQYRIWPETRDSITPCLFCIRGVVQTKGS